MPAAFFDLDNTLIRGSSLFHVGRALVRRGLVSRRDLLRFTVAEFRYVYTRTEITGGAQGLADRLIHLIAGHAVADLQATCADAVNEVFADVSVPLIVAHVKAHQTEGRPTFLVTASPAEIAVPVVTRLGMTGYVATQLEQHDGFYTGRLAAPVVHGPRKAAEVAVLAARHRVSLQDSYLYSDSINDLPLLRQVRYPVVVNGNRRMQQIARASAWGVLDTDRPHRTTWPHHPSVHECASEHGSTLTPEIPTAPVPQWRAPSSA